MELGELDVRGIIIVDSGSGCTLSFFSEMRTLLFTLSCVCIAVFEIHLLSTKSNSLSN